MFISFSIPSAAEINNTKSLYQLAEKYPESKEVLLQKAKVQELRHSTVADPDEYRKVLVKVDTVLNEVETELASHSEGKLVHKCRNN